MRKPFVTYLRFHRLRSGKMQREIASEIGVAQSTYCDFEKGYKKPGADLYLKIAIAINRPVEEIIAKLNGVNLRDVMIDAAGVGK